MRCFLPLLAVLFGCAPPVLVFLTPGDIERAAGRGDVATVCQGLTQAEDAAREKAASLLATWRGRGGDCTCDHLVRDGAWDPAVLSGLRSATTDTGAGCAASLLDDDALVDRAGAAQALLDVRVPSVRARLAEAAKDDPDPAVRAAALPALRGTTDPAEQALLFGALAGQDARIAAAAAGALAGVATAGPALVEALHRHPAPEVRVSALAAYQSLHVADWAKALCGALDDEDAGVRLAAAGHVKGSRTPAIWSCVGARMQGREPDAAVRAALLYATGHSAAPEAADALCEAMGPWVRAYVTEGPPAPEADVFLAQNDRDPDRSYACVEAALAAGGYAEAGKTYLCDHFRELGGGTGRGCPRRRTGGREISF